MRNCVNLDGAWDFTFTETPFEGRIPAGTKYESTLAVPGCFDVMAPWFGKRGTGFFPPFRADLRAGAAERRRPARGARRPKAAC